MPALCGALPTCPPHAGFAQNPSEAEKLPAGHLPSIARKGKEKLVHCLRMALYSLPILTCPGKGREKMSQRSMETHSQCWNQLVFGIVFHCKDETVYIAQALMANRPLLESYLCSNLLWDTGIHGNYWCLSFLICNSGIIIGPDSQAWARMKKGIMQLKSSAQCLECQGGNKWWQRPSLTLPAWLVFFHMQGQCLSSQ